MVDSSVAITAGSGTAIDAQLPSGGELQQTITIGDGANAGRVAAVEALGSKNALDVNLAGSAGGVAQVSSTLATGTSNVAATVGNSGNGTIVLFGGTYTALAVVFEASVDSGTNWFPIDVTRADGSAVVLAEQFAAAGVRAWNYMATGYTNVRIRATSGTLTAAPSVIITQGPFLVDPSPTIAPIDGSRATASSALNETAVASAITAAVPMWELVNPTGSGKLIRVTEIAFAATITTAVMNTILLQKRSAASTGGTAVTQTTGKHDTLNAAISGTSKLYTAIPTVAGSVLGNIRGDRLFISTTATQAQQQLWQFGNRPGQALILRPGESLNLQAQTAWATTPTIGGHCEWTEEPYQ